MSNHDALGIGLIFVQAYALTTMALYALGLIGLGVIWLLIVVLDDPINLVFIAIAAVMLGEIAAALL